MFCSPDHIVPISVDNEILTTEEKTIAIQY